jgi:pseudouridine kinase
MKHKLVCIGAVLIDELYTCRQPILAATSNPATLKRSAGGVMRNIAHHLALLDIPVHFITVVGNDAEGTWLKESCERAGIDMTGTMTADCSTGKYTALLNPDGSLYAAACSNPCESFLNIERLRQKEGFLTEATLIIADANLQADVLEWLAGFCRKKNILLFIEPVSVEKAKKLSGINLEGVFMLTPNEDELPSLSPAGMDTGNTLANLFQRGVQKVWLRKGRVGSEIFSGESSYSLPSPKVEVRDITGAGDAALAGWIAAYYLELPEKRCLAAAHAMAAAVLQTEGAVDDGMTREKLFSSIKKYYPDEQ